MLSAHFAPALIAKSFRPSISLPAAMFFCILPDFLHGILIIIGVERFGSDRRYTHTLLITLLIAIPIFVISLVLGTSIINAGIYAMCTLSHYVLDLINRERMALTPWGGSIRGLGLNDLEKPQRYHISLLIEIILVVSSVLIYGYSVFNGNLQSLIVPAGLLGLMLIIEIGYYRIVNIQ